MDGEDIYGLFADDEPQARRKAATLADIIRRKEGLGTLGMLTGDRVLAPLGAGFMGQAARGQGQLANAGAQAGAGRLREALARRAAQAQMMRDQTQVVRDQMEAERELAKEGRGREFERERLGIQNENATGLERLRQAGMDRRVKRGGGGAGDPLRDLKRRKMEAEVMALEKGEGTPAQRAAADARTEGQLQNMGKDLADTPQMANDLAILREAGAKEDVPGFGPLEGRLPNLFTSDEGVKARQAALRSVASYKLKMTGTAASEKEAENIMESLGMGRTATPEQFRAGLTALAKNGEDAVAQVLAKYPKGAIQEFKARGGKTSLGGGGAVPVAGEGGRTVVKTLRSKSTGKTKLIYDDGTEEIR